MSGQEFTSFTDGEGVTGPKGWNEEYNEVEEAYDVDPDYLFAYDEEAHIYCEICHCYMSGPKTFEAHLAGSRHNKNVKNSEMGAPIRPGRLEIPKLQMKDGKRVTWKPKCQAMVETFDKPLIGLQFVTEWCHRNRFVEPRYYCSICKAKCDVRMLMSHLTGVKHRGAYMKLFYPDLAARVRDEGRKTEQAPLAEHYAKQIEEQEGRQPMRVKAEGFPNCEGDDDDKELEEFITANKRNFYRHLRGLGLPTIPTYSESRKSGEDHGGCGSQPTMGSSGMSRSFSVMGYARGHSASDSGYDSVGPSGYQPLRPQMGFDSYQPQRSATSRPMSQSRPYYDEESDYRGDYRGQSSPDYGSGHFSADYGGQSGGYGGQTSGCQQGWHENDNGFDRFQSGMATSSRNSSAMGAGHSFKPLFPSHSADWDSGPSYGMRGSRSSGRPYPANRPSRFPARGALSEGSARVMRDTKADTSSQVESTVQFIH